MNIKGGFTRDRIIISNPETYEKVEIRNMNYDDGEGLTGYNGNAVIGYGHHVKDIFFLSIQPLNEKEKAEVYDKVEEMFGQDGELINLMIYDGNSTIYNVNDHAQPDMN